MRIKVRGAECGVRGIPSSLLGSVLWIFLCPVLVFGAQTWQWIDAQRVQAKLNEGGGFWLIDVRGAAAFQAAHIEGSVNIPADALANKTFSVQKTLILVDDALGQRSARGAADGLVKKGLERVSVLEGGIAAWKQAGLPMVEYEAVVRGVTADELKWAIEHSIEMNLYDLRSARDREQAPLKNSEAIDGKTIDEQVGNVKTALAAPKKRGDLAAWIRKPRQTVLVFSASADAEGFTRKVLRGNREDVRYLIGGYEALVFEMPHDWQVGACTTCPGKGR